MMRELSLREENGALVIDFNLLESWESFETIAVVLEKNFQAQFTHKVDGPESRVWSLTIEKCSFRLHNNPYGNFFKARFVTGNATVKRIFEQWSLYS